MSINRLLQDSAFEPEQIDRIAAAYKEVLHGLRLTNRIDPLTEIVAEKVFGIAQSGAIDTARITESALKEFGNQLAENTRQEIISTRGPKIYDVLLLRACPTEKL